MQMGLSIPVLPLGTGGSCLGTNFMYLYTVSSHMWLDLFPLFSVTRVLGSQVLKFYRKKKSQYRDSQKMIYCHSPRMFLSASALLLERQTGVYEEFKHMADIQSRSREECMLLHLLLLINLRVLFCHCQFSFLTQSHPVGLQEMLSHEQRAHFTVLDNRKSMSHHFH